MYVDGFVLACRADNRDAYIKVAREAAEVFLDHGATRVVECWGDDVPDGVLTSFPMAVKREADEVVLFSWIEFPDKATRETCHASFLNDPRMKDHDMAQNPFDGKRMIWGGFTAIVDMAGSP